MVDQAELREFSKQILLAILRNEGAGLTPSYIASKALDTAEALLKKLEE